MPKITLILTRPMVPHQLVELDGERMTLGRSKSCTILVEDRFLSRTHAELIARDGRWFIRDCGSANGTFVNSVRIDREIEFRYGDTITMGDTDIKMGGSSPHDEITQVGVDSATPTSPPPPAPEPEQVPDLVIAQEEVKESAERTMIVHRLALELLGERSVTELFEVIVDHVMEVMKPSRVAISILGEDGESLEIVKFRTKDAADDDGHLTISRTLLSQIIEERKVIAYTEVGSEDGSIPESMVVQGIFSAVGAPLLVNDRVLGVLYLDYRLSDRTISEDDAQLAAQIARVAALKLESTRLRQTAFEKERLDQSLRVARAIQMRMLPQRLPLRTDDSLFEIGATLKPAGQVGGDFYDFYQTDNGRLYLCIGDVSGDGIPAAMLMAVSRAMFRAMFLGGGSPGRIMADINRQLAREAEPEMSVVAFCAVLDPVTGDLRYSNAGYRAPLLIGGNGSVRNLPAAAGSALGVDENVEFVEGIHTLSEGDAICLASDGVVDSVNEKGEGFSSERLRQVVERDASRSSSDIVTSVVSAVDEFVGDAAQKDDLTLLLVRLLKRAGS